MPPLPGSDPGNYVQVTAEQPVPAKRARPCRLSAGPLVESRSECRQPRLTRNSPRSLSHGRNRRGLSGDPKVETALKFALAIVAERGWVSDDDIERVRRAGYSDGEIIEILAAVAQVTFMNYFDHIAETEVDFPVVEVVEPVKGVTA